MRQVEVPPRSVLQPLQVFAVSQTVQTASTLNRFAREVSEALQIRENINGQLHFGTEFLQEQVDILWIQQNLACDLEYRDMCGIAVIGGIVAGLVLIRCMRGSVRRSCTATKQALLAMKPSGNAQGKVISDVRKVALGAWRLVQRSKPQQQQCGPAGKLLGIPGKRVFLSRYLSFLPVIGHYPPSKTSSEQL
ncbi:hypothetical protein STEG23_035122 [Scotinomys teguina]